MEMMNKFRKMSYTIKLLGNEFLIIKTKNSQSSVVLWSRWVNQDDQTFECMKQLLATANEIN
jgi:hypothetical protein